MSDESAARFDRLAEDYVARLRQGSEPSIEEYVTRAPALAGDIRELFPVLASMEGAKPVESPVGGAPDVELGDFRIIREIGRGGMGLVYEAEQKALGRRVALKVLPASATNDPRYLERFRTEARAAARLEHPNVVPVIGYGEHDGIHYFAMQYIEGRGLDDVLRAVRRQLTGSAANGADPLSDTLALHLLTGRVNPSASTGGPTPIPRPALATKNRPTVGPRYRENVVRILLQATEAVAAAHARGVLHRDLKPSNFLLDACGKVWVADFGLCKTEGAGDLTLPEDVLGTLRYVPPERLNGESDVRGDVYGLGVTLYELLTRSPAYPGEDRVALLARIGTESPPRPRSVDPHLPRDLEAIVLRATARDPADRYRTAEALASDLRAHLGGFPVAARPPRLGSILRTAIRRHKPLAVTLAGAVLALLALSVVYVSNLARERAESRLQTYVAHLAAAEAALRLHDTDTASRLLAEAPAEYRNWEWRHLRSRLDRSLRVIGLDGEDARGVAYSPDGRYLAVTLTARTTVLDDATSEEVARLEHAAPSTRVRWSPDGHHVAVGTYGGLEIWRWPEPRRVARIEAAAQVSDLSFDREGRRIATGGPDGTLRVWDAATGVPHGEVALHRWIHALDFRGEGDRVVVGGGDGHVVMVDVGRGEILWTRRASRWGLHGVTFVGTERVVTASEAHHAIVWSAADGTQERILGSLGQLPVATVYAPPDGSLLVLASGRGTEVWDTGSWDRRSAWPGLYGVQDVALHPGGRRMATASHGAVREWQVRRDPDVLRGHQDDVFALAYAPSGDYVVSGGVEGVVRKWDPLTGETTRVWIGHGRSIAALAVAPDSRQVAAGDYAGDLVIWDAEQDRIRLRLPRHEGVVKSIAWSPDGRWLASGDDAGWLAVWDPRNGTPGARTRVAAEGVGGLAFLPDGTGLVVGDGRGRIALRALADLAVVREVQGHDGAITGLDVALRSRFVATVATDDTLRRWDLGSLAARGTTPIQAPLDVAFAPDGSRIAVGTRGETVRLVDSNDGRLVATLNHHDWINAVAWAPDGQRLLSASSAAEVRIWDTRPLAARCVVQCDTSVEDAAEQLVEVLRATTWDPDDALARLERRDDLGADVREAAVRAVHRWRGSADGLVARLWREATPRTLDRHRRWVALGMAAELVRAAGHRNRPDSRRNTLYGVLLARYGAYDHAVPALRRAMMLNAESEPELYAVDLCFLTLSEAGRGQATAAENAWVTLQAHLADHPAARTPRVEAFEAEAREALDGDR